MYERILVPLDGSDFAEIAIPYATELGSRDGGEVLLASVSDSTTEQSRMYRAYLDKTVVRVQAELNERGCATCSVSTRVVSGNPVAEILRLATHEGIGLIIMASRGVSGRALFALGNIASKVLQSSSIPVMLVRAERRTASSGDYLINKILLPLDASPSGAAAVPHAVEIARLLRAAIVLFYVEPQPRPWLIAPGVEFAYLPASSSERQAKQLLSHMEYLDQVAKTIADKGVAVSRDAGSGAPAAVILQYAKTNDIDLIALSTHGASGVAEFVYGGVTEKLIHAGDIPLLIVRPLKP